MPLLLRELRLSLDEPEAVLSGIAAKKLNILPQNIQALRIVRQSVDARDKSDVHFKYSVLVTLENPQDEQRFSGQAEWQPEPQAKTLQPGVQPLYAPPVVAGCGPAGLFCAYLLSQYGFKPLIIERGQPMEKREKDFAALQQSGRAQSESNVCFGEGGAGAFSDGKLTTRIKDARANTVLDILVAAGAEESIRYSAKPHLGTEHIRKIVVNIRNEVIKNGGQAAFNARLEDLDIQNGVLKGITLCADGLRRSLETGALVLATGHSARDTYELLLARSVVMQKKPFAIGLRVEHPREMIDKAQYGAFYAHPRLGAADYRLAAQVQGRGVYTFCMCPGGVVINSSTEDKHLAVNGMSYGARDMINSNSAVVVTVSADDVPEGPLGGVAFQRRWEKAAYALSGGGAPAQMLKDFISGKTTKAFGAVLPSFQPFVTGADLNACLPEFVSASIKAGFAQFGRQLKGFDMAEAVLTGVETRTSSPVRILRGETLEACGIAGLYPAGEGGGHAGGIVSAAADGIRVAERIIETYKPCY